MPRILLAHTGSDDREMYAEYFRTNGFEVIEAGTTDAATPLLPSCDLMVTGLMVPGTILPVTLIEGAATGRWGRPVPVIVVTASIVRDLHRAATAAGARRVLLKPCYPQELLRAVQQALAGDDESLSR